MLKSLRTTAIAALTAAAVLSGSAAALAQNAAPNPAAIQLFEEGRKLMGEGKYKEACPKLAESARLSPAVGTHLNLAKCYEALGKTASAWTNYKQGVFLGKKLNDDRVPLAEQKAAELEPKLMKIQIKMSGDVPGLTIHQDDQDVGKGAVDTPIPTDPGEHVIEATAPGYSVWSTHVTVTKEGQTVTVAIPALVPKPESAKTGGGGPSPLRPVAYAVGGVGVAGLVVGGAMGGLAMSAASSLKDKNSPNYCPNDKCATQAAQDAHASANTKALVSTIGLSVGGAALVTGVVLFVVSRPSTSKSDDAPKSAQIIPSFGPGGGGLNLVGHF